VIASAEALLICAGAGMGVDSGLPDFRGTEGFWRAYPVLAKRGLQFEEMANPRLFETEPSLAWAFYGHRLELYRNTTPHRGFTQVLQVGCRKPHGYFVFTSNVDGQFQKAGSDPDRIVECHGSIRHFQCMGPCSDEIWEGVNETVRVDLEAFRAQEPLPKCPNCSRLARPNILMFGDWSWLSSRTEAQQERFLKWLEEVQDSDAKLAVIELGAETAIPTVRHMSEYAVQGTNGKLIRVNPREASHPPGQIGLPLGALEAIEKIAQFLPSENTFT